MGTVLIVEDDWLVARRIASLLRNAGHTPVLAPDTRAALRAAEFRPDVIVLDLGLPDVQGQDLLEHFVRAPETADASVVVVTGNSESAVRLLEQKPAWLADVVTKPIDSRKVVQAVRTALAINGNAKEEAATTPQDARRRDVIFRLIAHGPDRLASHAYRRLCIERSRPTRVNHPRPLEWPSIAQWALLEGLVNEAEAALIAAAPRAPSFADAKGSPESPVSAGNRVRERAFAKP